MAKKLQSPFDSAVFLASAGKGRSIAKYRKNQIIFSQGNPADAVFYIQKGKVRVSVVSDRGQKRSSQSWDRMNFSAKAVFRARSCA